MTALIVATLFASTPALADGASTYSTYCATCHGATGKGDGAASASLTPRPADFSTAAFWSSRDEAALKKVIKEGGAAAGKSPLMPPWGPSLSDAQIDEVLAYIKTLKK